LQIDPSPAERDQVTPLIKWGRGEKQDTLAKYCSRVKAAKSYREAEAWDDTWRRLRDIYRLKMLHPLDDDMDSIAVAIAFATINVIEPSVAVNHPKVTVHARTEDLDDQAAIVEAVVNYWWRHNHIKQDFRAAVKDSLIYGVGWLKVGWRYAEHERPMEQDEYDNIHGALNEQADSFAAENPHMAHLAPSPEDIHGAMPDTAIEVTEDAPFVERISPFDIYVDPEATTMQDAKWIAQKLVLPLERVRKDDRYNNSRKKVKSDSSLKWFNEDNKDHVPEDEGRVTLWEFYDLEQEWMCTFVEQEDVGYLVDPTPFPYPYGQPFVYIPNYTVPDQFYAIGEIEAIEPLQDELNDTRSDMVQARKLDIAKWLYKEDAFGPEGLDALTSQQPYTAIPVEGDIPISEVIMPMPRNDANAQFYTQHSEVIESDIDRVTGVNEYMRGSLPEIRRTATEASIIQDAANARAADKLDKIEAVASEISRMLVQLAQKFMTVDSVALVVGADGSKVWVDFTPEDIQGEYLYEVEAGSTQPKNDTFKRQQAQQLLQALGPFISMGVINVPELLSQVLRDGFGMKNPEKFINAPMPMVDPATGMPMQPPPGGGDPNQPQQPPPPGGDGSVQQSGGPQPPAGPNVPPENPAPIQGVPAGITHQLQNQFGLLQGQ